MGQAARTAILDWLPEDPVADFVQMAHVLMRA
jgi:hypothetical protein